MRLVRFDVWSKSSLKKSVLQKKISNELKRWAFVVWTYTWKSSSTRGYPIFINSKDCGTAVHSTVTLPLWLCLPGKGGGNARHCHDAPWEIFVDTDVLITGAQG